MLILIILIISFFLAAGINSTVPMFIGIIASLLILSGKIVGKTGDKELKDKQLLEKLLGEKKDERDIKDILESLDRRITNLENYLLQVQPPQQPGMEFQPVQPEKQEQVHEQVQEQEEEQEMEKEMEEAEAEPEEQEQEQEEEQEIEKEMEEAEVEPEEPEKEQEVEELQAAGMPIKTGGKLTIAVPEEPGLLTEHWKKIQQQFIENWTGILGSIIMVMGVAFLGIYTALKLSPVYRFVMLVVFSVLVLGLFFFLKSKPKWVRLALWLRSGAGAIFLFACLGASTIDGLKWVDHPLKGTGLVLLLMGIVLNLYLSFIGGNQVFASLHVLLSLVALSIAPPTTITFIAAAIVTLFGTALTYREKWEYHLLLTISLFFAYHLYWYYQNGMAELSRTQHLTGIIAVAAVSVLALLVHYRSLYRTTVFERLPFFVHFTNWVYFGIGLYVHSMGSAWKPVVIGCGSIAAFLLARQARRLEIRWLFITDTLAAQAIALFALFSMAQWKVNPFFILGMMLLETLIFLVIMMEEKENLLAAVGTAIKYALGTIMIAWALYYGILFIHNLVQLQVRAVVFIICGIFAAAFHFYLVKKFSSRFDILSPSPGYKWLPFLVYFLHGFLAAAALYLYLIHWELKPPAIALVALIAFFMAKTAKNHSIRPLFIFGTLVAQAAALAALLSLSQWQVYDGIILGLMLLESLLFLVIMVLEKEKLLCSIGTIVKYILGISLLWWVYSTIDTNIIPLTFPWGNREIFMNLVTLLTCTIFATLLHFFLVKRWGSNEHSLPGVSAGLWLPFSIYFIHGLYAGFALYVYLLPWDWKPAAVAVISITAFLVARQARTFNPTRLHPLYIFGTLTAQAAALTTLLALSQWNLKGYYIAGLIFVEILLFFVLAAKPQEKEKLLCGIGTVMKYIMGIILLVWAFAAGIPPAPGNMTAVVPFLVTLLAAAVFGTAFHFYLLKILEKYDEAPLKKQEINWQNFSIFFIHAFYAGMAAYLYFLDWTWKPAAIALVSITGFLVARQAKSMAIKWLYQTGTLLAQAAALLTLLSLSQWQVEAYFSYALMFIETLLFLVLMLKEKEIGLRRIGFSILFIIAVVLTAAALGNIHNTDTGTLCKYAIAFLACTAAGTLFHIHTLKKFGETIASIKVTPAGSNTSYSISAIGILLGWLLLAAFINTYQIPWWEYILAAAGIALIAVRRRYPSDGLGIGLMMFVLGFHAFGWNNMSLTDHIPVMKKIIYSLPFLMLSFAFIKMPLFNQWKRTAKAYGIYWFYLHLMVASYYIFTRISLNITGALWLAFSIITLETIYWLQKKHGQRMPEKGEPDRFLLHMAYLLIGAFLIMHLAVHLHTTDYIGIFRVRLLVALGAIVTFIYWTLRQLPERENSAKSWRYVHPLFLDLIFVFSVFTVVVEVNSRWFPITWIAAALICLIGASSSIGETSRIRFYSLLLYWASTVYVALIPATGGSTALHFYEKPWVIDSAAILLQFVYIVLIHKVTFLEGIRFPKLLGFLSPVTALINRRKNLWIHYPLFISVALFLYQAFDKSILTLLWVVECFLIFIAAVILKENHFRYLAMTGLALTLIRLVFYDLAKSDTFTRALVFIGVGILMLVMNSIYNKYKDRF